MKESGQKIVVFSQTQSEDDELSLTQMTELLKEKMELIPEQYRDTASCAIVPFQLRRSPRVHAFTLEVFYRRPETQEEIAARECMEAALHATVKQLCQDIEQPWKHSV